MSGTALAAPYLDTDADQLSFALGHPPYTALAVRNLTVGGLDVQLRLLGASHQVFAGPVAETVACLPGVEGGLPDTAERQFDGWAYHFDARVLRLSAGEFGARVASIRAQAEAHPHALCGIFPGSPDAVTALTVESCDTGPSWRTWHTYPQSRAIVATHTRLEVR
ncbi:DUF2617 family protein [Streptomyces chromofuscus]|uniref:DUF2617 family protein n=1 Tax=Streptomyces chromofuscus TaxID=42881 RepID=A0A7M2TBH3_STRCW|nr:DUF2617 family protein [Streptomyces chromofuscus]QOV45068.1 DUF2617 family protein [Streptomyces chromofuscus]GGT27939.1 hypothetical protein GCM10010254_55710 [Streptomyces chromofuscus]